MAGNYSDVPAPRLAYDRDGTAMSHLVTNTSTVQQLTVGELVQLNDEDSGAVNNYGWYGNVGGVQYGLAFIFPELRDIAGYLTQGGTIGASRGDLQTSVDTTNGLDGTWVTQDTSWDSAGGAANLIPMRENITTTAFSGIKGLRVLTNMGTGGSRSILFHVFHLYGTKTDFTGLDTLRMWHPTLDQPLDTSSPANGAHLDWGDAAQGTTGDKTFRIKNNSASLTANSIDVTTEVATNASPTLQSQITYSDGGAFASTINIGNLAPGVISSVITVRRTTSLSAELSLWWWRTVAEAGSWT